MANSYVIDADNYLFKNMFRNDIECSTYFSVYREDCDNEWFLVYGDDYKVQDIIVDSKNGRILSGVSFWDAPTAEKIVGFIDKHMQVASLWTSTGITWSKITSKNWMLRRGIGRKFYL